MGISEIRYCWGPYDKGILLLGVFLGGAILYISIDVYIYIYIYLSACVFVYI